jgi:uncharacterized membrane protein
MKEDARTKPRLALLDAARGGAVVAMFAFHFIWDLGHFGYIDADIPYSRGVKLFGHAIAIAFLFIAGVSLVLAHEKAANWRGFWRRILIVGGAALLVSAGTYVAFPDRFVFFGILHCIAVASLLAAPFLFLPWPAAAAVGLMAGLAPLFLRGPSFNVPMLYWVGLSTIEPPTNDYRPLLPWAGALFVGVAAMQLYRARGQTPLFHKERGNLVSPLAFLGRHSLPLYLIHQPLFFAAFSAAAWFVPTDDLQGFVAACESQCAASGGTTQACHAACLCTVQEATRTHALAGLTDPADRAARIGEIALVCADKNR